jgi:hypothetical protein
LTDVAPLGARRYITSMPIYVFQAALNPRVIAFANEIAAALLLPSIGPWRRADGQGAAGVIGLPEFIETAIAQEGYILLNVGRGPPAPSLPIVRRANDA